MFIFFPPITMMRFILIVLLSFSLLLYLCEVDLHRHVRNLQFKASSHPHQPITKQERIALLSKRCEMGPVVSFSKGATLVEAWKKDCAELRELLLEEHSADTTQEPLSYTQQEEHSADTAQEPLSYTQQTLHELQKRAFNEGNRRSQSFLDSLQLLLTLEQDGILTRSQVAHTSLTLMDRYTSYASEE